MKGVFWGLIFLILYSGCTSNETPEEQAIKIVKNYRVESNLISLEEYMNLTRDNMHKASYYRISNETWSAKNTGESTYLVIHSYKQTVMITPPAHPEYKPGDYWYGEVVFSVDIKTKKVKANNSQAITILDTIRMVRRY